MTGQIHHGNWLSARRLRAQGSLLAIVLWGFYAWTIATPGLIDRNGNLKGTDFLHFYTLGSLAIAHRGTDLYDMNAQAIVAAERVPPAAGIRYLPLYPPQISILFAPLAHLSYAWALTCWWIFCTVVYAACLFVVWRGCPNLRGYGLTIAIVALGFPGFFNLIAWGQTSALALACFTLMFFALRRQHDFVAGLVLGCLIFKPQLGLAAAIVFVMSGAWRVVVGAILSAMAQIASGMLFYGIEPFRVWLRTMVNLGSVLPFLEPRPYQTHCLRTFWSMIVPWPGVASSLYVASAVVVLVLTIAIWMGRHDSPLVLRFSALLLATVLVAPHLTVYDLVILAPAMLLLADWLMAQASTSVTRVMAILLYSAYAFPLLGPFTRYIHVQMSVIALAALLYLVCRISMTQGPGLKVDTSRMETARIANA